jgi:putative peptidoglycan lipid II flippase
VQFARDNRRGVARSLVTGLRLVNFITIPSVCALIVLAKPMVQALFERGTFQAGATDLTAGLLPYAAAGLVALAANVVLTRCCFACKETAWPVTISVGSVVVNVLLSLIWLPTLGARGLLLANSISQTMQAVLLLMVVARLVSGIDWGALVGSMVKIGISAFAMFMALSWINALGVTPEATLASRAWFLFGQIAIGGAIFIAAARMLGVEELELARRTIVAKFERNLVSPPDNREAPIA